MDFFTLPNSDSDSDWDWDSKPDGYIVLCRNIHTGSDPDPDPCTESFLNRHCIHFRDRYLSQGQMSIPIPYISIRGSESGSKPIWNFCIVRESGSESESESSNVNKPFKAKDLPQVWPICALLPCRYLWRVSEVGFFEIFHNSYLIRWIHQN